MTLKKTNKAISISKLLATKTPTIPFEGNWLAAFGKPATKGVWIVWGNSGNGKTAFAVQLAAELSRYMRVAYNSLEEKDSDTMKKAFDRVGGAQLDGKVLFIKGETIEELEDRLGKHKSADAIIIDSLQYTMLNYAEYIKFKERHSNKLIILISHADGKEPKGETAKAIRYDAMMKIRVEGHRATSLGRYYGTGAPYTIWAEGAENYWSQPA